MFQLAEPVLLPNSSRGVRGLIAASVQPVARLIQEVKACRYEQHTQIKMFVKERKVSTVRFKIF